MTIADLDGATSTRGANALIRRYLGRAVLVAILVPMAAGCRAQRIWTGVDFGPDGTLVLVAEEPQCGCLSVVNVSNEAVQLRSSFRNEALGEVTLKAAERRRFRFDWASSEPPSFYVIRTFTTDGGALDARMVLEFEDRPRWVACETAFCEFEGLNMSVAFDER